MILVEEIKNQIGSSGKRGWPVAVRDRIAFPKSDELWVTEANVVVTFLWTMRDAIVPKLEKSNLAMATNFYTPAGLQGMVRNILGNPYIRYVILLGEEYAANNKLTSANALRSFFKKGINKERRVEGFESAVYFDSHIPTELIEKVVENVELIDLNEKFSDSSLAEKIEEANKLIRGLAKKPPFLDRPYIFEYEKSADSFPYEGGAMVVSGQTIPETWVKVIAKIYRYGRKNLMNANTDRWVKEINNMVAVIHDPQNLDLSLNPFLVPLTKEKIEAYQSEILSAVLPEGKAYTYGNELRAYFYPAGKEVKDLAVSDEYKDFEFGKGPWIDQNVNYVGEGSEINQIADIIEVLKRDFYSKACVAITWHPAKELMRKHKSSPCLVLVQALIQEERLNLTVFFRSHDMTQGWPENAYGCAAIQKEIAMAVGVETGLLTIISGSAQIYNSYYQQVEEMLAKYNSWKKNYDDAKGNYLIKVKDKKIIVTLAHPQTGAELEKLVGKTAYELKDQIARGAQLATDHAIYLGTELQKAEDALKNKTDYEQDR